MWALKILHEKNWRVSLCVQELHHGFKFSLNSCSHSGISELARPESANNGFMVSFLTLFLGIFGWLGTLLVIGFTANNGTGDTGERINFTLILSFSSLTVT